MSGRSTQRHQSVAMFGGDTLTFKVLLLGEPGTGKSALIKRYVEDQFQQETGLKGPRKQIDIVYKDLNLYGSNLSLEIFEGNLVDGVIAGATLLKNAHGAVMVYDVTNPESFDRLINLWAEIGDKLSAKGRLRKIFFGSKADLDRSGDLPPTDQLSAECGYLVAEGSSKAATNVNEAFQQLALEIFLFSSYPGKEKTGAHVLAVLAKQRQINPSLPHHRRLPTILVDPSEKFLEIHSICATKKPDGAEQIKKYIAKHPDHLNRPVLGYTPLHLACWSNQIDVGTVLLNKGAHVDCEQNSAFGFARKQTLHALAACRNAKFANTNIPVTEMDLSYMGMRYMPHSLREFDNLRVLDISGNMLNDLPRVMGFMQKLKKVDLEGNPLASVPKEYRGSWEDTQLHIRNGW